MAAGATPRLMRTLNERTLLGHLRRAGPTSRAQLARDTGLSQPTVSLALGHLARAPRACPTDRPPARGPPRREPASRARRAAFLRRVGGPPASTSPIRP